VKNLERDQIDIQAACTHFANPIPMKPPPGYLIPAEFSGTCCVRFLSPQLQVSWNMRSWMRWVTSFWVMCNLGLVIVRGPKWKCHHFGNLTATDRLRCSCISLVWRTFVYWTFRGGFRRSIPRESLMILYQAQGGPEKLITARSRQNFLRTLGPPSLLKRLCFRSNRVCFDGVRSDHHVIDILHMFF